MLILRWKREAARWPCHAGFVAKGKPAVEMIGSNAAGTKRWDPLPAKCPIQLDSPRVLNC
jgi:hypothetical protein